MKKVLKDLSKKVYGNVILIGDYEEKIIDLFNNNEKVNKLDVLSKGSLTKKRKFSFKIIKKVGIKEFRKKFKKKKIDYIICDYETIKPYFRHFVKDSVYICCGELIFIGDIDSKKLNKIYDQFGAEVLLDGKRANINLSQIKSSYIKDKKFYFKDISETISDFISDVLVS